MSVMSVYCHFLVLYANDYYVSAYEFKVYHGNVTTAIVLPDNGFPSGVSKWQHTLAWVTYLLQCPDMVAQMSLTEIESRSGQRLS
jgi:hypothetical protein